MQRTLAYWIVGVCYTLVLALCAVELWRPALFLVQGSLADYQHWFPRWGIGVWAAVWLMPAFTHVAWYALHVPIAKPVHLFRVFAIVVGSVAVQFGVGFILWPALWTIFICISPRFPIAAWVHKSWCSISETQKAGLVIGLGVIARGVVWGWANNSAEADAACRILISAIWHDIYLQSGSWDLIVNPFPDWLPLHFYLTGSGMMISKNTAFLQSIHALFALGIAIQIYRITLLFTHTRIALLATALYIWYPASMWLSTQIMSEHFFILLLLLALQSYLVGLKTERTSLFWRTSLWISLACLVRYEGWILPWLWAFHGLWVSPHWRKKMILPFISSGMAALAIMCLLYVQGYDPLRGIRYSDFQVAYNFSVLGKHISVFTQGYQAAWIPFACILAVWVGITQPQWRRYFIFCLLFTLPFLYKNITFSILPQYRYATMYSIVLIPLWATGLYTLSAYFYKKRVLMLSWAMGFISLCWSATHIPYTLYRFPTAFKNQIQWVKTNIPNGNFILDYHQNLGAYQWIYETQAHWNLTYHEPYLSEFLPLHILKQHTHNTAQRHTIFSVTDYQQEFKTLDTLHIQQVATQYPDAYWVIFPNGMLASYMQQTTRFTSYQCIYAQNGYQIWQQVKP